MLLIESNFETQTLTEEASGKKTWFIEGVFMQADVVNRNKRVYPMTIMDAQVDKYIKEYVNERRALGELNHPSSPIVDPDRASHLIESITKDGKNFIGKARILGTTVGNNVRALLEGGVKLGVSTRGIGSVKKNTQGINEVQEDFRLATVDIVFHPSAPDAFVQGLMENAAFVWNTIEEDVELINNIKNKFNEDYAKNKQAAMVEAFSNYLQKITLKK